MIYFLLIAILAMTGWIMITLNEIDKTNHRLMHDTNLNQAMISKKIDDLHEEVRDLKDK